MIAHHHMDMHITEFMLSKAVANVSKIRFRHGNPFIGSHSENPPLNTAYRTYVAYDSNSKLYKIGRSTAPEFRINNIKLKHPELELLFILEKDVEKELHKRYKVYRVYGEWFYLSERILNEIKLLCK